MSIQSVNRIVCDINPGNRTFACWYWADNGPREPDLRTAAAKWGWQTHKDTFGIDFDLCPPCAKQRAETGKI